MAYSDESHLSAMDFSVFEQIALYLNGDSFALVQDAESSSEMLSSALEAALSHSECMQRKAEGYQFPLLEVDEAQLSWRVSMVPDWPEQPLWVYSFFPENIPQMAIAVAVTGDQKIVDVFPGSTWQMQTLWEQALGSPGYFWPIPVRYAFHVLFEPDNMWSAPALPEAGMVSQLEAEQQAGSALLENHCVGSEEALATYRVVAHFSTTKRYNPEGSDVWTILYYLPAAEEWRLVYSVDLDGYSGELLNVYRNDGSVG